LLQSFGMNRLESEVYVFLLQQASPVTAYRVGHAIGKPTANVYKAIDALARKGAVMIVEGPTRLCRPSPPTEFLGHLEAGFHSRTQQAAGLLSKLETVQPDEGIFFLESADLVLERSRAMLTRAEKIAVVDAFPAALEAISSALDEAINRKVEVYVQTYSDMTVTGAHMTRTYHGQEVLDHWNCQQLNVVVDSAEALLALLHNDLSKVFRAIWTQGLYLSCILHVGLLREHTFHAIAAYKDQPGFPEDLGRLIDTQPFFHSATLPGQQRLFQRYGVIK
ncbi:MAG: helix-turn-helix domain-containing protein, partial [Planctomycetota bacterium]